MVKSYLHRLLRAYEGNIDRFIVPSRFYLKSWCNGAGHASALYTSLTLSISAQVLNQAPTLASASSIAAG